MANDELRGVFYTNVGTSSWSCARWIFRLHKGNQGTEGQGMSWCQEQEIAVWEGSGDNQGAQTRLVRVPH